MNRLVLNKSLYKKETIDKAKIAFSHLTELEYSQNENYHILVFEKCHYDENLTKKEFENYVVNLMVSKNG